MFNALEEISILKQKNKKQNEILLKYVKEESKSEEIIKLKFEPEEAKKVKDILLQ